MPVELGCNHTHIAAFETAAGEAMAWDRIYLSGTTEPAAGTSTWTTAMASAVAGRKVCISGKTGATWAAIASGSKDALFTSWANYMVTFPTDGIWCFYHEPEDNTGATGFTAADFRAATARMNSVMQPILHPAGWRTAICLMDWTFNSGSGRTPTDWYDASTDFIGIDPYDFRGSQSWPTSGGGPWANPAVTPRAPSTFFHLPNPGGTDMMNFAKSRGKGFGIFEIGFIREQADTAGSVRTASIEAVADYIKSQGMTSSDCEMACYFEMDSSDGNKNNAIRSEPASMAAFVDWADESSIYHVNLIPNVDTDQSASLQNQINAVPNGTADQPNIIILPKGRYRIDYGITLTIRQHLRITVENGVSQYQSLLPANFQNPPTTPDWNQFFTSYTDLLAETDANGNPITGPGYLGVAWRAHWTMNGCTDVIGSFLAVDGPWTQRADPTFGAGSNFARWNSNEANNHGFKFQSYGTRQNQGYSYGCRDCGWEDCYGTHIGGDGFLFTCANEHPFNNVPISCFVRRCHSYYAGRHGLTASSGEGCEVTDYYSDWNGYGGLDIEPNIDWAHCWDATFTRVSLGGNIGPAFQAAGSNSDTTFARKKNLTFINCEALHGATATFHISGTFTGQSANDGFCIFDGCRAVHNSGIIGITASGFDDVIVRNCTVTTSRYTNTSYAVQGNATNSLTITNNVFNGFPGPQGEGFDELYNSPTTPVVTHYGNVWAMGTKNDGVAPVGGNSGSIAQILPPLQQAASGPATEVDAVTVQTLPAITQFVEGSVGAHGDLEIGFTGVFAEAPMGQVQLANIGDTVEAVIVQSLPALAQALTADASLDAVIAQTLPALAQLALGYHGYSAIIEQTLPPLRQAETGSSRFGPIVQTLPALVGEVVGDVETGGAIAQTLPSLSQSATGIAIEFEAVIDQTLPALRQAAAGAVSLAPVWPEWPVESDDEWLVRV
jgi:hypothetical protein